ncbi:hypothetical protein FG05_35420 [Fusarium graminearum]|nr:hypothetical protein FG05_35420 [Fusarium graminearum]
MSHDVLKSSFEGLQLDKDGADTNASANGVPVRAHKKIGRH